VTIEENKALVQRLVEDGVNQGNLATLDEVVAQDFMLDDVVLGRERFKAFVTQRRDSFPDWHIVVEDWVAQGDKVVIREAISGTHLGVLQTPVGSLPPTGSPRGCAVATARPGRTRAAGRRAGARPGPAHRPWSDNV
jgi:predicted ester cyclase